MNSTKRVVVVDVVVVVVFIENKDGSFFYKNTERFVYFYILV